jgi:DHA1 family inner membrane transport protein
VLSIQLFVAAAQAWPLARVLPWLALGPLVGLWMMRPLLTSRTANPGSRRP